MKRSFLFFLAVAAFAVVTGCEEKIVSETPPEITLDAAEITIPGAGGQCEFVYSIDNPVADGKLTANSEDGWMTDFTVASDTLVTFVAEPNESGVSRSGLITLKYTYGADGEVTADVKVSQGVAGAAPEIELGAAPSIPAEGGDFELTYEIVNPTADGKISAASDADWLTLNADNPGVIAITAAANTGVERSAEINVVYEYGDGRIEAAAEVTQAAAGQASGYEYDMKCFDGIYYGQTYGNNGEYNYYTWISDIGFDADGYQQNGGTYYLFDIYVAVAPEDADNPLPPAGTYNLGSGPGMTEDMTFSYDYSIGVSIAEDGTYVFQAYFNEGTLTIEYEGSNIIMDAVLTDEDGIIHHVTYEGPVSYDNEGGDEPGPSTGSTLEQDLNIEAGTALASYVADDGYVMEVSLQFTDMEVDMVEGYVVPPGSIMTVDMFMPFKDNGELNPGTYDVAATYEDYTVYPGELYYDILPMGTYVSYYPDANTEQLGFVVSGAMEISGSALGGYTVTCDFTTDNGYTIECSYSGNLEIQGIPGPYSTLEGDYTLDLEGASGFAVYCGDNYYTGGATWMISLNPLSDPDDGFMTVIVAESTSFEEGIPTGTYEAGASVTILYPGEYLTGFMDGGYLSGTNYVGGFTSDGYVTEFAPAISGDLNITNNNDGTYIISFSFVDDLGNTWEGEWEGEMQLEGGSGSYYAPRRSSVSILRNSSFNTVDKKEVMENLPVKAVKLQPDNRTVRKSVSAR